MSVSCTDTIRGSIAEIAEKGITAPYDIRISTVEIAEIPRVSDTVIFAGIRQQKMKLVIEIRADNSFSISHIGIIHAQQIIIPVIIILSKLNGTFSIAGNTMFSKLSLSGRIDGIADAAPYFLTACSAGGYFKLICDTFFPDHIFQNKLSHRTSADIAVADEHYFYHIKFLSQIAVKGHKMPHFARVSG